MLFLQLSMRHLSVRGLYTALPRHSYGTPPWPRPFAYQLHTHTLPLGLFAGEQREMFLTSRPRCSSFFSSSAFTLSGVSDCAEPRPVKTSVESPSAITAAATSGRRFMARG